MRRLVPLVLLTGLSLTACAKPPQSAADTAKPAKPAAAAPASNDPVEARVRAALKQLNPQVDVDYVGKAPLPGFREVIAAGQLVYVSDDGKYLVQGNVIDVAQRKDLMQGSDALAQYRQNLLKSVKQADRIVFAPANPKYTVSVFTDIECGYCRKLHSQIADYNKQGIAVEYLAWPRMGLGSQDHKDMISVWCAADRRKALTEAKASGQVAARDCTNPVTMEYNVGQRLGVNGTPAVFAPDGNQIGGYLPPAEMRAALDKLAAADAAKAKSAGMP
ncbi:MULTISPECIES: thioredoxin fold domain-containing protein [Pseudoxanthomonas]|jgi:thiol:disulfide interchange protein DsbC|uniref:Thiol:disulfide interchange protein n=1 Tax=Pseudoxanthomonas winnipegensis TaxID=2480810 RepID=A0A4Q8LGZ8_9GAMM|nr:MULTISPECIES: thioredoxin fold domain-containing protein [Pseudoxanthomonas]PZP60872.1 MAG: disulfide bond formation protein DsbC [Pseudoxanthomonas spadix]TAA28726.1 DsbC family protein [Pseudoxanthomonas winnipegensis]TMN17329.1 DsbC family protein [Pseudoxanthomonas sp. X-1]UAY74119.1 thioredoxin fold domain-containing protein [Pseudoxanthomonas sp. X-1]